MHGPTRLVRATCKPPYPLKTVNALNDLADVESFFCTLFHRFSLAPMEKRMSLPFATVAIARTCLSKRPDFCRNSNAT